MFERVGHRRIARILAAMNADLLRDAKCYFGGGTAIALLLEEYRESIDIDFLCADQVGYRALRTSIFHHGLNELFVDPIELLRDPRADQYGIRAVLVIEATPVQFEIVREGRITLTGMEVAEVPVSCLSKDDLFAEKLLANADRWADKGALSRDYIDLLMMQCQWGPIPHSAWDKATGAYGDSVYAAVQDAGQLLRSDEMYRCACLAKLGIDETTGATLAAALIGMDMERIAREREQIR